MKHLARITIFIGLIIAFALAASVQAAETSTDKQAKSFGQQPSAATSENSSEKNSETDAKKTAPVKESARSTRAYLQPVWIHDTQLEYLTDEDGDGYYHHFRFRFDADTDYISQALVAEIALDDGHDETVVFTSNTFWINSISSTDTYEVSTALNSGYPTQTYDLVLRLYDAFSHELLEEWTYLDDSTMDSLYLEDAERDTLFSTTPYIHHYELTLKDDFDQDGFASQVIFNVDVDAPGSSSDIRIGVDIYSDINGWESIYLSDEITISGSHSEDNQTIKVDLDHGYPNDLYQLKLTVYESLSNAILASETVSQTVALESLEYEEEETSHDSDDDHRSSSSSGSGGSMGWLAVPLLALAWLRRRSA